MEGRKVVICGAGAIGSSIAYFLAKKGVRATVIERSGVACAASGKAGGFLALDWCDHSELGPLARASFALHAELATEFSENNKDYGFRVLDTLSVETRKKTDKAGNTKLIGNIPTWLDTNIFTSSSPLGTTKSTAQVYPPAFTNTLINAAKDKIGTEVIIGTVVGVKTENNKVIGVKIEDGRYLEADVVVIAMGPWSHKACEWFPSVAPVKGSKAHSIVLRPENPSVTAHALFLQYWAEDGHSDPEVYL